jgi:uncharacterized glyoxalase superfamily metalloenzyme YdcJ
MGLLGTRPVYIRRRPNALRRCIRISQLALARAYPKGRMAPRMVGFRSARSLAMEQRHHPLARTSTAAVPEINRSAGAHFGPKVVEAFLPANSTGLIRENDLQQEKNEERWPTTC